MKLVTLVVIFTSQCMVLKASQREESFMYQSDQGKVLVFRPKTLDEIESQQPSNDAYILVKRRLKPIEDDTLKEVFPAVNNSEKRLKKRIAVGKLVYQVLGYNMAKEIRTLFNAHGIKSVERELLDAVKSKVSPKSETPRLRELHSGRSFTREQLYGLYTAASELARIVNERSSNIQDPRIEPVVESSNEIVKLLFRLLMKTDTNSSGTLNGLTQQNAKMFEKNFKVMRRVFPFL